MKMNKRIFNLFCNIEILIFRIYSWYHKQGSSLYTKRFNLARLEKSFSSINCSTKMYTTPKIN